MRFAKLWTLLALATALAATSAVRAQDEVRYIDQEKKAETTLRGTIRDEKIGSIELQLSTGRTQKIPATDIIEVTYRPKSVPALDYRKPMNIDNKAREVPADDPMEREELVNEALTEYRAMLPRLADETFPRRYLHYRMTQLLAWRAESDAAKVDEAITAMKEYLKANPDGWETVSSYRTLARLQEQKGDVPGSMETYEKMGALPDLPKDLRQQCDIYIVQAMLDNEKFKDAQTKLQEMGKNTATDDPQARRIQVYQAACAAATGDTKAALKQLDELADSIEDPEVLGLVYNTRGDCYRKLGTAGDVEKAFWQYLWVDVVYNQDRVQHARALYHLAKLFKTVKQDDARAEESLTRLIDDRKFIGLEYRKRAEREMPKQGS